MYHSRLHVTNGLVSAALDALTGEPLELVLEENRENILKSNLRQEASPLKVCLRNGRELRPPKYAEIRRDGTLRPSIECCQGEGEAWAEVSCPRLVDMESGVPVAVSAVWKLELAKGDRRMYWHVRLENNAGDMVEKCYFPYLNGIWLGDDWTKDELYMPVHSGDKTVNPTRTLSATPHQISWKWQEYQYTFTLGGPYGVKNERLGCWERECGYSGPCSMLYMILSNPHLNMSVYLTCRNDALRMKSIRAATYGESWPGVSLALGHVPCLEQGSWESEACVLMLYAGDWHVGADDYRAWRNALGRPALSRPHRPAWFMESPGLVAHYDFQYQGGGIVHRFRDIPALYAQAREMGLSHLLLSGWNVDGFDNGFPMYTPSPELGTEEDLRQALRQVREAGGHVAFYINSRLCNLKYAQLEELRQTGAVMDQDGQLVVENYGAEDLNFACMCAGAASWQQKLTDTVKYLTRDIGADSMYLDQLGMARGLLCYREDHLHGKDVGGWNQGYEAVLARIRESYPEEGVALLFEGASDIHAPGASGQLISTMFFNGAFPELYKYTFPEDVLVDMMCPPSHSAMRPAHIARQSTFLLHRAFCVGSYLWIYDLEEDNTFRWDAAAYQHLKQVIALRQSWLTRYGHGIFTDDCDLLQKPDRQNVILKTFRLKNGLLAACAKGSEPLRIALRWERTQAPQAKLYTLEAPDAPVTLELRSVPGGYEATLPDTELCYLALETAEN